MLKKVKIENYKSVVNQTLDLGRFNVVIGANGCGKSNLLEAIALAGLSSSGALLPELFESRGIRLSDTRFMRSAFDDLDDEFIRVSIKTTDGDESMYKIHHNTASRPSQWEDVVEEDTKALLTTIRENSQKMKISDLIEYLDKKDGKSAVNVNLFEGENHRLVLSRSRVNGLMGFTIYSLEESALRSLDQMPSTKLGRTGRGLLPYLKELSKTEAGTKVLNEVKENLQVIDWFEDLDMPESGFAQDSTLKLKDRYVDEHLDFFDQRSANEAFLYLLFYFTLFISEETPSFFAIDNIESSLNPKLCRLVISKLAELAEKHDKQVILTTHSPFVLDGLDEINDKKRLFVVNRNTDGYTVVNQIKENKSKSIPLSDAWLKGYIGGLPNNF
ncbi:MAG: AAA family ATPase [Bacteroidaceae bacterium]|nr:AAA family ATPase [Bacteroidaceae bacterium]